MRAEGGLVPDALGWDARSALLGWRFYGHDVEAVSHALEGFVGEDGLCSLLRIFQEDRHFCIGIAFSHVCDVDASGGVGSLLQGDVWCRLVAFLMNQNVFRRYLVGERGGYLAAVVAQVEGDVYGIFRHRNEEYVLETLRVLLCLWIGEPFLEEGGEGVAVDDLPERWSRTVICPLPSTGSSASRCRLPYQRGITLSSSTAIICCFWLPAKV